MAMSAKVWDAERASACIAALQSEPGGLLPILHALQEAFGYIDTAAVPMIAAALNLSRAEGQGGISG